MPPNQTYFHRNQGEWNWKVRFELVGWRALWTAAIPWVSRLRVSSLILTQNLFGPFAMWTRVDGRGSRVHHTTKMIKWGLTLYRSEKDFVLDENGVDLRIEGVEYFWPLNFVAVPFAPKHGTVDASATGARYQMPFAATTCEATAVLAPPLGYMKIETPYLNGRFELDETSNRKLLEKF